MSLPKGWIIVRGRYYYRVPKHVRHLWDNKEKFKLGDTEAEAFRNWHSRIGLIEQGSAVDMNEVFDKFWQEYVLVQLKEGTHKSYRLLIEALRPVFGHMHPSAIKAPHVYAYLD